MYNSKFFTWNLLDFIKGLITAVFSAVLTVAYQMITVRNLNYHEIGFVALTSAVGYLLKNLTSNSDGLPLSTEIK